MNRLILLLSLILTFKLTYGQDYKAIKTIHKHSDKITEIATCDNYFATGSYDRTVSTWDYNGKRMFKYTISEGSINALCFLPDANSLLVAISEFDNDGYKRYIIKQFDMSGKVVKEFVDATMNQEQVNLIYLENNTGAINAVINASKIYPELNVKSNLGIPQVKDKLSHQETIQDIKVSPNQQIIASIDKYNYLKIWRTTGKFIKSFQIKNSKKDTYIYFLSDTTLLVTPNIILNIENNNSHKIVGFEDYMATPLNDKIYFSFDYNKQSESEKLYDNKERELKDIGLNENYSLCVTTSNDKFGLLGVDGLVRLLNTNGELLSTFGKDRDEEKTFRGKTIHLSSEITKIRFSPNGVYLISGDKNGKVIIWRNEK
jgi:WD40 repeat protein